MKLQEFRCKVIVSDTVDVSATDLREARESAKFRYVDMRMKRPSRPEEKPIVTRVKECWEI